MAAGHHEKDLVEELDSTSEARLVERHATDVNRMQQSGHEHDLDLKCRVVVRCICKSNERRTSHQIDKRVADDVGFVGEEAEVQDSNLVFHTLLVQILSIPAQYCDEKEGHERQDSDHDRTCDVILFFSSRLLYRGLDEVSDRHRSTQCKLDLEGTQEYIADEVVVKQLGLHLVITSLDLARTAFDAAHQDEYHADKEEE